MSFSKSCCFVIAAAAGISVVVCGQQLGKSRNILAVPGPAPVAIENVRFDESVGGNGAVILDLVPTSRRHVSSAVLALVYWQNDRPLGGQLFAFEGDATLARRARQLRLNNMAQAADTIAVSVFRASSPGMFWQAPEALAGNRPSQHARNMGAWAVSRFSEEQWKAQPEAGEATASSDCSTTLETCTSAAKDVCGSMNVGGVIFIGSTCTCCFYCRGQVPPDCYGGGGGQ
jgi:hypothetical protein